MPLVRFLWLASAALLVVVASSTCLAAGEQSPGSMENDYLTREDDYVTDAMFVAELCLANGDIDGVRGIGRKLIALRPRDRMLARRVAELCRRAGANKDVVSLYESLLTSAPDDVSLLADLARAQCDAGLTEEGLKTCRRMLQLRGESPTAFAELAQDLAARDATEVALTLLDQGVERYPDDQALRLERALMLYRKGEYEKAAVDARLLARGLASDRPQARLASFLLARSLEAREGGLDDYFQEVERDASTLEGEHAAALLALAQRLRQEGETEQAISCYKRIIDLYPGSAQAQDARQSIAALAPAASH